MAMLALRPVKKLSRQILLPVLHEAVDQVGAKESGTPSNEVDLHPQWVAMSPRLRQSTQRNSDLLTLLLQRLQAHLTRSASSSPSTKAQAAPL